MAEGQDKLSSYGSGPDGIMDLDHVAHMVRSWWKYFGPFDSDMGSGIL